VTRRRGAIPVLSYSGAIPVLSYSGAFLVLSYGGAMPVLSYGGAFPVLSYGGAIAVRWQTGVRFALGENEGKHTAAPAACSRFTPEDAAKARRHARISM
jgi:hypothetical protein